MQRTDVEAGKWVALSQLYIKLKQGRNMFSSSTKRYLLNERKMMINLTVVCHDSYLPYYIA